MSAGKSGRRASRRRLLDLVQRLEGERHPRTTPVALREAEAFVARELERSGLEVERPAFRYRGTEHRNVVGRLSGQTPERPRVLVGAHFDSAVGTPGADDNASGVAAVRAAPDLELVTVRIPFRGWLVPPTCLSDHSRLWDAGYPALMLTDTAFFRNPHYHGEGDRAGTLDPGFMSRVAEATAEAVRDLAEPTSPHRAPEADLR